MSVLRGKVDAVLDNDDDADYDDHADSASDKGSKRRRTGRTANWKHDEKKAFLDLLLELMPHVRSPPYFFLPSVFLSSFFFFPLSLDLSVVSNVNWRSAESTLHIYLHLGVQSSFCAKSAPPPFSL